MADLDQVDLGILEIIQEDGRKTLKEIGEQLSLSTTPIFERIKRMEAQGVISQYVALVDPAQLDIKLRAFVEISVENHSREAINDFVSKVIAHPEIMECHFVTGDADFLLVIVTKDIEHYHRFITEKLWLASNIAKLRSSFSLSVKKSTTAFPLNNSLPQGEASS